MLHDFHQVKLANHKGRYIHNIDSLDIVEGRTRHKGIKGHFIESDLIGTVLLDIIEGQLSFGVPYAC